MPPIVLRSGDLSATILPELGAGLADFSLLGPLNWRYPLLRRASEEPSGPGELACFLMTPWCNRIRDAVMRFGGAEHRLQPNWPDGTAIHGVAWKKSWTITDRSPVHARLEYDSRGDANVNWPFPFRTSVRYEIDADRLVVDLDVENAGAEPMPAGLGLHPYLPRTLMAADEAVEIRFANTGQFPLQACLPTGHARPTDVSRGFADGRPLANPRLDDIFDGLDGPIEIRWPDSGVTLRLESTDACGKAVVFAPSAPAGGPMSWFCAEPVTMLNDGINLLEQGWEDTGVRVLAPGERLAIRTSFVVARD